jgi:uncharacterized membrane protein
MAVRFPEIDMIKGVALVLMVIFHYFYMAHLLGRPIFNVGSGLLRLMAVAAHNIFIFMVGVNLTLSYSRSKDKNAFIGKQFKRALLILAFGMLMTAVTYVVFPDKFIRFGIFHFIAAAIMMSLLFIGNKYYTGFGIALFGLLNYIISYYQSNFAGICDTNRLTCFVLGIYNVNYAAIDHFAFIPFFLKVLLGMGFGQVVYKNGIRPMNTMFDYAYKNSGVMKTLGYLGKQSLNIYLVHWVIIYYLLA